MNINNTNSMTRLSNMAFHEATIKLHSAEEAVRFLKQDLITRTVRSNLEKLSDGTDIKVLQKLLVEGLIENHPDMKKDSIERRVRGWLNPQSTHSIKKQDAIEITFILHAPIDKADEFIALVSEEKLHWRSPEEIVYIYGLLHRLTYKECIDILHYPEVQGILQSASDYTKSKTIPEDEYTEFIKKDVENLESEKKLIEYLQANYKKLGHFHNTAYEMFMEMLGELESPSKREKELGLLEDEPQTYTIREILKEFFYQDIVLSAKQEAVKAKKKAKKELISKEQQYTLDLIQKTISDSWPDEVSLSKMKNRKADVTRKSLILLFLATDGGYDDEFDSEFDLPEEEIFEDILERLNGMLYFCGFSSLDPRNPFDWLIIYCVYVQDMFDIDPRLQSLLEELFRK